MAIARLAETLAALPASTAAGNYDISISAPASTPNGVCVIIVQVGSTTDSISTVTYGITTGAVPLTERRFATITTEAGALWLYWASGVTFPSGAQTVRIVRTGTANLRAAICPMTVAAGQQVAVDTDIQSVSTAAVSNPSWTMTTVAAPTECYMGIVSGLQTMTTTQATNWTSIGTAEDTTSQGRGWARRTMNPAGDSLPGWIAATAEDYAGISVAFKEAPLAAPSPYPRLRRSHPSYRR